MTALIENTGWLLAAAFAGCALYLLMRAVTWFSSTRAKDIALCRTALDTYEGLLTEVLDDPATPESVERLLHRFDAGVMDRGVAWYLARSIIRDGQSFFSDDVTPSDQAFADLAAMSKARPDLYAKFAKVVACGFVATMRRYWFSARVLNLIFVNLQRDPVTPALAVECAVEHLHPTLPPFAAAA